MFRAIKEKLDAMGTVRRLCEGAETHALQDRQREPGAEHFLLAALDLPDQTAGRAFRAIGADPEALKGAIRLQYERALRSIGVVAAPDDAPALEIGARIYDAAASGRFVMQELAAGRSSHRPLLGAHVVGIVAGMAHGVAPRALREMGIDPAALKSSADSIATAHGAPRGSERKVP